MNLTPNEQQILDYLENPARGYVSPTKIAEALGKWESGGRYGASSWASPICLQLVRKGLVERNKRGCYKAKEEN